MASNSDTLRADVYKVFESYGEMEKVRMLNDHSFFIDFREVESALRVAVDSKTITVGNSNIVRVDFSSGV